MTEQLSLIPEKPISPKARKVVLSELPEDLIGADPDIEFIESVKKFGILQPIGLIDGDTYAVAFGRRRIKAARAAEHISIPALIYPQGWTPASVLTLIENRHRTDNLPAQLDAIATLRLSATPEEICVAVGMTQAELSKAIKMLNELAPELREAMKEGRIKATTAQKAAKLPVEHQQALAKQDTIKAKDLARYEPAPITKTVKLLPEPQPVEPIEVNSGDLVRGKSTTGETIEGIVDLAGRTKIKLSTGEMLEMETVELLEARSGQNEPEEAIETNPEHLNAKVSKQIWKLQAKPLVEQLLKVVPENEELRQYLELIADALKVRS
jgi:ParB/RepB/Spo0J family partition protein